jgi:glucose/arabinose dehydrogenase
MNALRPFAAGVLAATMIATALPQAHPAAAARPAQLTLSQGFRLDAITSNLSLPTAFAFVPDGRIFIAEKGGRVKVWKDGQLYAQPLIDISDEVNDFVDRGLLGMAVDPDFMRNGYLYLLYAWDAPGQDKDVDQPRRSRLVRYTVQRNTARPSSGVVLLDDHVNDTQNHSVGALKFDRDGYLWVSLGDGSLSAMPDKLSLRAQDVDNVQGKLLRIDPKTGNGVPGNPFFDENNPKSAASRIWAYGLRNPFRFALHPTTTLPYVGDVGWNTYESLMIATPGANFGWPCVEGAQAVKAFADAPECKSLDEGAIAPKALSYPHAGNNASVTAGDFNRGENFPPEMKGDFFWGDYSTQTMFRTVLDANGQFSQTVEFATTTGEPVDIQFGPDGALYYLSIYSGGFRRIVNEAGPLGSLATITQPLASTRPVATILAPFDGDTVLGGAAVTLTGAISNAVQSGWRVTRYDGRRPSVITETQGLTASFVMPKDMSDDSRIEAIFSASNAKGDVAASKITLHPFPSDGYIRSWWLHGGYPFLSLNDDAISGSEANYVARPGDVSAYPIRSPSHNVNLLNYISPSYRTVAYAFVWIEVPEDRKGLLGMNSDDGLAAWLNGKEIWRNKVSRFMPDDKRDIDLPPIELKKGLNALLLKIDTNDGDWQFKARVLNPDGSVMQDAVAKMAERSR